MLNYLLDLFNNADMSPHGICLLWRPDLLWTHVVSDGLIAAAYFSIPTAIAYLLTKRDDIDFRIVAWAFALFIVSCGATHIMSIWTLWQPVYGIEALVKVFTAVASVLTAFSLWHLMPAAITWPSPRQLQTANAELNEALLALRRETEARQQAEQKLRHAQKMEALGQFTGGVAHDFNNLLTIVLNNIERAARLNEGENQVGKALANAKVGAERAAALTKQLLAFSRQQSLNATDVDLNGLLKEAAVLGKTMLPDNIQMSLALGDAIPAVKVDPNEAVNAFINIIANARDALPRGGAITVSTRTTPTAEIGEMLHRGPFVVVTFTDTGLGMSQDVLDRAFEPFFTTKAVGQGSGLGLSQVYGFAQQSGGDAVIVSHVGKGTSVSIHLPAVTV